MFRDGEDLLLGQVNRPKILDDFATVGLRRFAAGALRLRYTVDLIRMPKTTLFLGSSSAAKSQAKVIVEHLSGPTIEFLPWWDAFTAGKTLLEELDNIRAKVDGAILLFSPEAETTVRKQTVWTPNLNVLFEFGYFYGHFGKEKVAILKYGDFYLPSDFGGYIHIFGSKFFRRGAVAQVGKRTKKEFGSWVAQIPST